MAVSLKKGANLSLSSEDPGLKEILIGLGWNARVTSGSQFDLDASAFLVGDNGKVNKTITRTFLFLVDVGEHNHIN